MTRLQDDVNGNPVPALRFRSGGAQSVSIGAEAARSQTEFSPGTLCVSLYADCDCYIAFGDGGVMATSADHFLPGGMYLPDIGIGGGSAQAGYISVISAGLATGTLYISEKE